MFTERIVFRTNVPDTDYTATRWRSVPYLICAVVNKIFFGQGPQTEFSKPSGATTVKIKIFPVLCTLNKVNIVLKHKIWMIHHSNLKFLKMCILSKVRLTATAAGATNDVQHFSYFKLSCWTLRGAWWLVAGGIWPACWNQCITVIAVSVPQTTTCWSICQTQRDRHQLMFMPWCVVTPVHAPVAVTYVRILAARCVTGVRLSWLVAADVGQRTYATLLTLFERLSANVPVSYICFNYNCRSRKQFAICRWIRNSWIFLPYFTRTVLPPVMLTRTGHARTRTRT